MVVQWIILIKSLVFYVVTYLFQVHFSNQRVVQTQNVHESYVENDSTVPLTVQVVTYLQDMIYNTYNITYTHNSVRRLLSSIPTYKKKHLPSRRFMVGRGIVGLHRVCQRKRDVVIMERRELIYFWTSHLWPLSQYWIRATHRATGVHRQKGGMVSFGTNQKKKESKDRER